MRPPRRHPLPATHARPPPPRLHRGGFALSDRSRRGRFPYRRGRATTDDQARKDALLEATLPDVPFDGWSVAALRAGARSLGLAKAEALELFPGGAADLVAWFSDWADRRMLAAVAALPLDEMKVRDRIATAVRARLTALEPHRE